MEMVEIRNVSKWFGSVNVLQNVSLVVPPQGVFVIIGPSGSGKTTLLRCVNFLEEYQQGEITVTGSPVGYHVIGGGKRSKLPERDIAATRAQVGMVFQSYNLFPHMSVLRNLTAAPIRVKGMQRREAEEMARDLLGRVGLAHKADAYPTNLSGGQQQRVAIARALAMQPKVMLFDEVTSALDPELVDEVLQVMQELARDGMTMMVVTHEMQFARDVANQVVFMDKGTIVEKGDPATLFSAPESKRLQTFLNRYNQA